MSSIYTNTCSCIQTLSLFLKDACCGSYFVYNSVATTILLFISPKRKTKKNKIEKKFFGSVWRGRSFTIMTIQLQRPLCFLHHIFTLFSWREHANIFFPFSLWSFSFLFSFTTRTEMRHMYICFNDRSVHKKIKMRYQMFSQLLGSLIRFNRSIACYFHELL